MPQEYEVTRRSKPMMTPAEQRRVRLKNDFLEMENIRGSLVLWRPAAGVQPFVEEYELTVRVSTIIGPDRETRQEHIIRLRLPEGYPVTAPETHMLTRPQPFHPNWYITGKWCYGTWDMAEGLGHHVVRMIRTLQFDAEITNAGSAANSAARDWYNSNQHKGWFPVDTQRLPDPTHETRFRLTPAAKLFRVDGT
jgi:ubiquitin-protein ligase